MSDSAIKAGTAHLAFPIYTACPPGHGVWPVTDYSMGPHARPGDKLVVDYTARRIVAGEFYLFDFGTGPAPRQAFLAPANIRRQHPGQDLYGVRFYSSFARSAGVTYQADGYTARGHYESKCLGMVVGLFEPARPG